jgi:hypothetical protein
MKKSIFLFLLLLVFAGRASADGMDLVTQTIVWGTACPPGLCSQPGDTWSYSFLTPADLSKNVFNTLPTSITTSGEVTWFPQNDDGGFELGGILFGLFDQLYGYVGCPDCFRPPCPTCTAVLVPGVYDVINGVSTEELFGAVWSPILGESGFIPGPVVITAVPEPSTLILIVTGLLVLAFIARRNLSNHRRSLPDCVVSL